MRSVALSPANRQAALDAMAAAPLDVLVVGAGVVGGGAALDAATRGLSVGLVDARDFAKHSSLIRIRKDFIAEILKSAEDL